MSVDWSPRKRTGVPAPRDPITGAVKSPKPTLFQVASEHGWDVRKQGQGWSFTKGERVLWVAESDYDKSVAQGHLFEGEQPGMVVPPDGLTAVLTGTKCICDPRYKDRYDDQIPDPGCPVLHPFRITPFHPVEDSDVAAVRHPDAKHAIKELN